MCGGRSKTSEAFYKEMKAEKTTEPLPSLQMKETKRAGPKYKKVMRTGMEARSLLNPYMKGN